MKIITVLSQKGGAGKTTLCIQLAVAATLARKKAVVIDLDPQASVSNWKDFRQNEEPAIVPAHAGRLPQVIATAKEHPIDLMVIDTAPHSEGTAFAAAQHADMILVPCRPAILDLKAIGATVQLATLSKSPAWAVLNAVPPRGSSIESDAAAAIAKYGLKIAPVSLTHRAAYQHSLTVGQSVQEFEPDGKAAAEVKLLFTWIQKTLYTKT